MSLLSPWSSSVWLLRGWLSLGQGWGGRSLRHLSTLVVFHFSCWLRVDNYFIWSFIGPVSFVIVVSGTPGTGAPFIQAGLDPNLGLLPAFQKTALV